MSANCGLVFVLRGAFKALRFFATLLIAVCVFSARKMRRFLEWAVLISAALGIAFGAAFTPGNIAVLSVPQAAGSTTAVSPSIVEFQSGSTASVVQTINIVAGIGDLQALVNGGKLLLSADGSKCRGVVASSTCISTRTLRPPPADYLTYASYPSMKVVSIDGNGGVTTAAVAGYTTSIYSAYRNTDGSFYVCGLAGAFASYAPAGGGTSIQLVTSSPKPCNFMAPVGQTLFMSSSGDWTMYRVGTAGTLPTTAGQAQTATGVATNSGGAQQLNWVLDNLGTTLFTCVSTGGGEYGVTRQAWASGGPSGAVTRIMHSGNIYCYAITGQVCLVVHTTVWGLFSNSPCFR